MVFDGFFDGFHCHAVRDSENDLCVSLAIYTEPQYFAFVQILCKSNQFSKALGLEQWNTQSVCALRRIAIQRGL